MYNRVIYELTQKKRKDFTEQDKVIEKEELSRYQRNRIPIYPYVFKKEIYFRIVYQKKTIRGFDTYEKAEDSYQKLLKGITEVSETQEEIKVQKKLDTVTLKDGYDVLLKKHRTAMKKGEAKYSSYSKKDTTIRYHILPYFEGKPIAQITKGDIAHFVYHITAEELSGKPGKNGKAKLLSVSMQHEVLMFFKMLYKETLKWFDIETSIDIDREVEMPKLSRSRKKYSREVGDRIGKEYENNMKLIMKELSNLEYGIYNPVFGIQLLISCTGMRIDEAIALKPEKFDYERKTLLIDRSISWHPDKSTTNKSYVETSTKTDAERTILLPDTIAEYLNAFIQRLKKLTFYSNKMYIFSRLGLAREKEMMLDPFSIKSFDNKLTDAYEKLRLIPEDDDRRKEKNHLSRHAYNTMLKNNHIEEYDRKIYLGHSTGSDVNEGYTHKSLEEEKRIAEVGEKYCLFLTENIPEFKALVKTAQGTG